MHHPRSFWKVCSVQAHESGLEEIHKRQPETLASKPSSSSSTKSTWQRSAEPLPVICTSPRGNRPSGARMLCLPLSQGSCWRKGRSWQWARSQPRTLSSISSLRDWTSYCPTRELQGCGQLWGTRDSTNAPGSSSPQTGRRVGKKPAHQKFKIIRKA